MIRLIGIAALVLSVGFQAAQPAMATDRSRTVARQFERLHPCPATGQKTGACPGWIRDHVIPLCAGGPDAVTNMQWQTVADAKVKDRAERAECRKHKHRRMRR